MKKEKQLVKKNIKNKFAENRGITIVALIITVIVMLILAGTAINLTIGENGIFKTAQESKHKQKIAEYIEKIELSRGEVALENMGEVTLDKLIDKICENNISKREGITKLDEQRAKMITKEGYIFIITVSTVEYAGSGDSIPTPPNLQEGEITASIEPEGWTNQNVKITLSSSKIQNTSQSGKFTLQYSLDEITWKDYIAPIEIDRNINIFVCIRNAIGEQGSYTNVKIANIDKLPPTNFIPSITPTSNSITIDASTAKDANKTEKYGQSGINEIWYSKDAGATWQTNENKQETTYTYTGLTQQKEYQIQVKVIDKAGNQTITTAIPATTGEVAIAEGNITIAEATWDASTHKASTTISKGAGVDSSLQIQYQVNGYEDDKWTTGASVTGLNHNDYVYARLWDGTNGGNYTSAKITDSADPQNANIQLSATSTTTASSITATVTHIDNESGVKIESCKYVYNTTSEAIGTNPDSYTGGTFTSNVQSITIQATEGGTYYLHVLTTDNAGNVKETISEAVTVQQLVTEITLNKTETTLGVGATETLTATISPDNASNKKITWTSSNESVAIVSDGTITAVAEGTTTITATAQDGSGKSASCNVNVPVTLASKARPGDYVEYDGGNGYTGKWQVLYNDNTYGLQIISSNTVTDSYTLSGQNGYNNAVNLLNTECRKYVNSTYATSGRCVGSNPLSPDDTSGTTDWYGIGFIMKNADSNYTTDYNAMQAATSQNSSGIHVLGKYYWLASRYVRDFGSSANFAPSVVFPYGVVDVASYLYGFTRYGTNVVSYDMTSGLRPIITLKSGIQTSSGDGSETNAYKLLISGQNS